jgi:inositol transport system substrate-binding protein
MFRNSFVKRLVVFCLVSVLAIGMLSGCGQKQESPATAQQNETTESKNSPAEAKSEDKIVIGVTLNHIQDEFMKALAEGLQEEAKKYPNLELKVVDAGLKADVQANQVDQFIAEKVDVICLNPTDKKASVASIEAAVAAGIPIYTVNTRSEDKAQDKCVTFVGSDAIQSGEIQMKYVAEEVLKGKGNIAIIKGNAGQEAEIGRKDGVVNILKDYPDIEIVAEENADWQRELALSTMENWIQAQKPIDVVLAQSCELGLGALYAIEDAGLTDKIKVSAIDAIPDALKLLEEGKITNLVFQDAKGQGIGAVATGVKIANGENVEKNIWIPYELVTRETAKDYYSRW